MEGDAFERIYNTMRRAGGEAGREGALHIMLGRVVSPAPLQVEVGGTVQEAARFYIAHRLLDGHRENVTVQGDASGALAVSAGCGYGSHSGMTVNSGRLTLGGGTVIRRGPGLEAGDLVLLLTGNDQTFYLIDKVVKAG